MPNDWAVQQLRLSLFANEPVTLSDRDWKTVTGQAEEPDRTAIQAGRQYAGKFLGGIFSMAYVVNRSDLVLNLDESALSESTDDKLPAIGHWNELSKSFSDSLSPLLQDLPWPIIRIAFGAILILPTNSRDESYRKLDEFLFSVKADPGSKELTYKINWPTKSKAVSDLDLNRITSWSSINFKKTLVQMTGADVISHPAGTDQYFVRLEVDHNTDQGRKDPFDRGQRVPIFQELLELARKNTEVGECK